MAEVHRDQRREHRAIDVWPVELVSSATANGGREWWIEVGGEKATQSIYSDPAQTERPGEMFTRLVRREAKREVRRKLRAGF